MNNKEGIEMKKEKMTKTEKFWHLLEEAVTEDVTLHNFNKDTVKMAIEKGQKFIKKQSVLKRTPKISSSNIWNMVCCKWLDELLKTKEHKNFQSFQQLEDFLWLKIAPTGFANHILGYDTEWIKFWTIYRPKFKKWYYEGHPKEKEAVTTAKALLLIKDTEPDVLEKVRELLI